MVPGICTGSIKKNSRKTREFDELVFASAPIFERDFSSPNLLWSRILNEELELRYAMRLMIASDVR